MVMVILANLAGLLFAVLLALGGLALMVNFRGVIDYHFKRSRQAARPL
ncbi:hypothetical protein AB0M46_16500 [Dactylosporangium sp. NPDC051485]